MTGLVYAVGALHEAPEQGWILHKPNGGAQPVEADEDFPIRENGAKRQKGNGVAVTSSAREEPHGTTQRSFPTVVGANYVRPRTDKNVRPYAQARRYARIHSHCAV